MHWMRIIVQGGHGISNVQINTLGHTPWKEGTCVTTRHQHIIWRAVSVVVMCVNPHRPMNTNEPGERPRRSLEDFREMAQWLTSARRGNMLTTASSNGLCPLRIALLKWPVYIHISQQDDENRL